MHRHTGTRAHAHTGTRTVKTTPRSAVVESGRVSLAPRAETPKKRLLPAIDAAYPSGGAGAAEGERGAPLPPFRTLLCRRVSSRKETEAAESRRFIMVYERRASVPSSFLF
jgi:hypothetical protein